MRLFVILGLLFQLAFGKNVLLSVHYPKSAVAMYLRGNGCGLNWDKGFKLTSSSQFEWQATLSCSDSEVKSNSLEVKVLVGDSDWQIGANHHVNIAAANVTDSIFPWFYTYKGSTTIIKNVFSSELNNKRDVIIYLPPSFNENTLKRYSNVLIMHDGQNLFDPRTSAFGCWNAQDTFDNTMVSGSSDEILAVGAYNTADRNNEYTYIFDESEGFGGKGDLYLDWIESTLIPLIASTPSYRADIKRETLGILGSSLGGLISCYAGWTRPTVYGKVGCMSSSFWWADEDFQNKMMLAHDVPASPRPHVYMDSGTGSKGERDCGRETSTIYSMMSTDGFIKDVEIKTYVQEGGTHDEASWSARFYIPVQFLYPSVTV